jgi:F0F1-type ATP synthase assembly protein I
MISVLIGVLIIIVVGAICFWAIDKYANDRRLANLLKLLVVGFPIGCGFPITTSGERNG